MAKEQAKEKASSPIGVHTGTLHFSHSGSMGDILYSLHFVSDIICWKRPEKSVFIITHGSAASYSGKHPYGDVLITEGAAMFMKPFLEQCGLFDEVLVMHISQLKEFAAGKMLLDLDYFREKMLNLYAEDIRSYYYSLCYRHFNQDFSINLFKGKFEGDERAKDYFLVTNTSRYQNAYIYPSLPLHEFKDRIAFIGLDEEYEFMKKHLDFKDMPRFELRDLADAASLMKGSRGVFGNQSGLFSLAEMLKVDRLLLSCQYMPANGRVTLGPMNVHVTGGKWFDHIMVIDNCMKLAREFFEKR